MCGWYKSRQHAGFLNSCCTCTWYQWRRRCDSNSWCVSFFFVSGLFCLFFTLILKVLSFCCGSHPISHLLSSFTHLQLCITAFSPPEPCLLQTDMSFPAFFEFLVSQFWAPAPLGESSWHSARLSLSLSLQVCLVGKSRNYQLPDEAEAEQRRAHYVESRQTASGITGQRSDIRRDGESCHENRDNDRTPGSSWGAGFQPRDRVETVRNCASLPRDFVDGVVLRVANVLLGMTEDDGSDWNRGGKPPPATKHQR